MHPGAAMWLCSPGPLTAVVTGEEEGQGTGLVTNIKRKQIVRLCFRTPQIKKQNKILKHLNS